MADKTPPLMRRLETHGVRRVKPDNDGTGDLTIHLENGAWMTWHPGDTARPSREGDEVDVVLPVIVKVR